MATSNKQVICQCRAHAMQILKKKKKSVTLLLETRGNERLQRRRDVVPKSELHRVDGWMQDWRGARAVDEDHLSGLLTSCTPLLSTSSNFHRGGW